MASRKHYSMEAGRYFFSIRSGQQQIRMNRKDKQEAFYAYQNYLEVGKNCEWLGKWNGKKFEDTVPPTAEEEK